jgi:hypothetical protein
MSKINASIILLQADGTEIACQKDLTLSVDRNLFPTTCKQSAGWDEHGNGLRSAGVSFNLLQSTTGLSSKELYDYINSNKSLMLAIVGFTYPYVMEVDITNSTINAPTEEAVSLSGNFKVNGGVYRLSPLNPNKLASWMQGVSFTYDTLDTSGGTSIPSAIDAGGGAAAESVPNTNVSNGEIHLVIFFLTVNSGQMPTFKIKGLGSGGWGQFADTPALNAGLNIKKFTFTAVPGGSDANCRLIFSNTTATNFKVSKIYWFKKI